MNDLLEVIQLEDATYYKKILGTSWTSDLKCFEILFEEKKLGTTEASVISYMLWFYVTTIIFEDVQMLESFATCVLNSFMQSMKDIYFCECL